MSITELSQTYSPRSSSAASSRAKPLVEPLAMPSRTNAIAQEWGFTPSSTTAALMLKRAERMKWNAERKHKREHMGLSFEESKNTQIGFCFRRCLSTFKNGTK